MILPIHQIWYYAIFFFIYVKRLKSIYPVQIGCKFMFSMIIQKEKKWKKHKQMFHFWTKFKVPYKIVVSEKCLITPKCASLYTTYYMYILYVCSFEILWLITKLFYLCVEGGGGGNGCTINLMHVLIRRWHLC